MGNRKGQRKSPDPKQQIMAAGALLLVMALAFVGWRFGVFNALARALVNHAFSSMRVETNHQKANKSTEGNLNK